METEYSPALTLTTFMGELDPDKAVRLARELSGQLGSDPESFHGDIWPGNIRLDEEGRATLGNGSTAPVSQRTPSQVEYISPEYFWDNSGSAPADVYSLGLLLYAGCNKGRLPFQPLEGELTDKDRSMALRRRMKGENIPAPEGVSDGLAQVLQKALAYEPEDRYLTAREFLHALSETDEALPAGGARDVLEEAAAVAAGAAVLGAAAEAGKDAGSGSSPREAALEMAEDEKPAEGDKSAQEEKPAEDGKSPETGKPAEDDKAAVAEKPAEGGKAQKGGKNAKSGKSAEEKAAAGAPGRRVARGKKNSKNSKKMPAGSEKHAAPKGAAAEQTASKAVQETPVKAEAAEAAEPTKIAEAAEAAGPTKIAEDIKDVKAAVPAASSAAREPGTVQPKAGQYKVQKDFEKNGRRRDPSVTPASQRKKRSAAGPVIGVVAALAVIGGAAAAFLHGGSVEDISKPFMTSVPTSAPTSTPVIITAEPEPTAEPTPEPTAEPTPKPTARPTPEPEETAPAETMAPGGAGGSPADDTGSGNGTGGPNDTGAGNGTGTGSGTGAGGPNDTGAGNGTGTGTGGGTGGGGGYGGTGTGTGGGTGGTTPSAPSYTVTPSSGTVYIQGIGVRIRTGPGTGYGILGSANTGYSLQRTGTVNGWTQVVYGGMTGYVYTQYVTDTTPATATPVPTAVPTATPGPQTTPSPEQTPTPTAAPTATPEPTPTPTATPAPPPSGSYTVHSGNVTYAEAKEAAEASGASLAVVSGDSDLDAIIGALDNSGLQYVWLGASFDAGSGLWKWSDGTTLSTEDSHWAAFYPQAGDDVLLLAKQDGVWQYVSASSEDFDPSSGTYAGKLGYVTE